MINYIPEDFFTANKTKVYRDEETCREAEGSAVPFEQSKLQLRACIIENGEVKECPTKKEAFEAGRAVEARLMKRKSAYRNIETLFFEALAEREEGRPEKMLEYLEKRAQVKQENPL